MIINSVVRNNFFFRLKKLLKKQQYLDKINFYTNTIINFCPHTLEPYSRKYKANIKAAKQSLSFRRVNKNMRRILFLSTITVLCRHYEFHVLSQRPLKRE